MRRKEKVDKASERHSIDYIVHQVGLKEWEIGAKARRSRVASQVGIWGPVGKQKTSGGDVPGMFMEQQGGQCTCGQEQG